MIQRPTMDSTLLQVATVMSLRGTCSRQQNGAVVARDGRVLATGYNGTPSGMRHCVHSPDEPSDVGCAYAVHAEANAVAFAARHGVSLDGATLYVTTSPCVPCAQLVINAGIVQVVAGRAYRLLDGANLLNEAGVKMLYHDEDTQTLGTTPTSSTS
jgi:dCMP deaminase